MGQLIAAVIVWWMFCGHSRVIVLRSLFETRHSCKCKLLKMSNYDKTEPWLENYSSLLGAQVRVSSCLVFARPAFMKHTIIAHIYSSISPKLMVTITITYTYKNNYLNTAKYNEWSIVWPETLETRAQRRLFEETWVLKNQTPNLKKFTKLVYPILCAVQGRIDRGN